MSCIKTLDSKDTKFLKVELETGPLKTIYRRTAVKCACLMSTALLHMHN